MTSIEPTVALGFGVKFYKCELGAKNKWSPICLNRLPFVAMMTPSTLIREKSTPMTTKKIATKNVVEVDR
jgi:hypothetical protein